VEFRQSHALLAKSAITIGLIARDLTSSAKWLAYLAFIIAGYLAFIESPIPHLSTRVTSHAPGAARMGKIIHLSRKEYIYHFNIFLFRSETWGWVLYSQNYMWILNAEVFYGRANQGIWKEFWATKSGVLTSNRILPSNRAYPWFTTVVLASTNNV
jgi:hypothetical protein